jgi:hypothetical protein
MERHRLGPRFVFNSEKVFGNSLRAIQQSRQAVGSQISFYLHLPIFTCIYYMQTFFYFIYIFLFYLYFSILFIFFYNLILIFFL